MGFLACTTVTHVGEKLGGWRLRGYGGLLVEEAAFLLYLVPTCLYYSFQLLQFPPFYS